MLVWMCDKNWLRPLRNDTLGDASEKQMKRSPSTMRTHYNQIARELGGMSHDAASHIIDFVDVYMVVYLNIFWERAL